MKRKTTITAALLSLVVLIAPALAPAGEAAVKRTALDEYVQKADPAYRWDVVNTIKGEGFTIFVVDLKSQNWRTTKDVDRTLWQHWLIVCKPDNVSSNKAFFQADGRCSLNYDGNSLAMAARRATVGWTVRPPLSYPCSNTVAGALAYKLVQDGVALTLLVAACSHARLGFLSADRRLGLKEHHLDGENQMLAIGLCVQ